MDTIEIFRQEKLEDLYSTYEINNMFADKLKKLEKFKIIVIADDSGSMNTPISKKENITRWYRLKQSLYIIVDIAAACAKFGCDVYFLNRDPVMNVLNKDYLHESFASEAKGYTPITPILEKILKEPCDQDRLIIIATDGIPTNNKGEEDIPSFKKTLKTKRRENDYVSIMACTENRHTLSYLNKWDKDLLNLDVIDVYENESKEVRKVQGKNFTFTYGDYIVKTLMGPIDDWFDKLDEKPINNNTCNLL